MWNCCGALSPLMPSILPLVRLHLEQQVYKGNPLDPGLWVCLPSTKALSYIKEFPGKKLETASLQISKGAVVALESIKKSRLPIWVIGLFF